jgi:hypothetical protein
VSPVRTSHKVSRSTSVVQSEIKPLEHTGAISTMRTETSTAELSNKNRPPFDKHVEEIQLSGRVLMVSTEIRRTEYEQGQGSFVDLLNLQIFKQYWTKYYILEVHSLLGCTAV